MSHFFVVVYSILSTFILLYFTLLYSANLGLLCMPHPGMWPIVSRPFRRRAESAVLVASLEGHPSSA